MKEKIVLTETEQRDLDLLKEEFKQRGGMTTQELIQRLNAIPFKDFIKELREEIISVVFNL